MMEDRNKESKDIAKKLKALTDAPRFEGFVRMLELSDEQANTAIRNIPDSQTAEARDELRYNERLRAHFRDACGPQKRDIF